MVDALTRIHAALIPGGALVDTQPVGSRWPVALRGEALGELETDEWLETIAAVDAEIARTLAAGLFEPAHEERYGVVHAFDSGPECLEEVERWAGTRVPPEVGARLKRDPAPATVEHQVRFRLLARR